MASWYREGLAGIEGLSCIEQRPVVSGSGLAGVFVVPNMIIVSSASKTS